MDKIRGIECLLHNDAIKDFLLFLADEPYEFYISWCMKTDSSVSVLPQSSKYGHVSCQCLKEIAEQSIWELVLQMYPLSRIMNDHIEVYEDFERSTCEGYLIYYDCGMLDAYVKDSALLDKMHNELCVLGATGISLITAKNDKRIGFQP